ncbi:MAG: hypothetical protein ACOYMN_16200 [Roseimicrobium sp.]
MLDENLPRPLKRAFLEHEARTVQECGFTSLANGELLARLEGLCDVFVTADKNLRYQQNLMGRTLAIVELPTNRLPHLLPHFERISAAVTTAAPGSYTVLD